MTGRLLRIIIGPLPLVVAISIRIGFFFGLYMFLATNLAITGYRLLLVLKVDIQKPIHKN